MRTSIARTLLALVVSIAGLACGSSPPEEPVCVPGMSSAALAPPAGLRPGEPYRWLARSWRSPLGLTVRTYGLAVEGVPVTGIHQVEIDDARGQLVHSAGSVDALLAELRARGAAWPDRHPLASLSG